MEDAHLEPPLAPPPSAQQEEQQEEQHEHPGGAFDPTGAGADTTAGGGLGDAATIAAEPDGDGALAAVAHTPTLIVPPSASSATTMDPPALPTMPAPVASPLAQPRRITVQLPLTMQMAYEKPQAHTSPPVSEQEAQGLYVRQMHWWQAHRQAATLRGLAEAKTREEQEVLECTFQPRIFTAQSYKAPHDPPRHVAHACPKPPAASSSASAHPPMTIPCVVTAATPAGASRPSSLSPLRQRGAGAGGASGVTDVEMSPRTRRQIQLHILRQQLSREAKYHAKSDLSRLSPQDVSPHAVRDYERRVHQQQQHQQHRQDQYHHHRHHHEQQQPQQHLEAVQEGEEGGDNEPFPAVIAEQEQAQAGPRAGARSPISIKVLPSPIPPGRPDARGVRHVAINLGAGAGGGTNGNDSDGRVQVVQEDARDEQAEASASPSYLRATQAWERYAQETAADAGFVPKSGPPPRTPPRARSAGKQRSQQQPAGEGAADAWGEDAAAAASSYPSPSTPPRRRAIHKQHQRRAGASSLSPARTRPAAAASDVWTVVPAAAAVRGVGKEGEGDWIEALEAKEEEEELTFFEQLQRERREWGRERAQLLTVIELQQRELGKRGGSVQERAAEIARDFARSVMGFEERLLTVETALQSDVKEIRRAVERLGLPGAGPGSASSRTPTPPVAHNKNSPVRGSLGGGKEHYPQPAQSSIPESLHAQAQGVTAGGGSGAATAAVMGAGGASGGTGKRK